MMSLFVFLVLLFGLLGVFLSQYLMQYREAYAIWIKEIVYPVEYPENNPEKIREICSKMESYSREICGLTDIILVLVSSICFTFIVILYTIRINIPLLTTPSPELNVLLSARVLTFVFFILVFIVLYYSKINIIFTSKSSAIDEKIYCVWDKYKCHSSKNIRFHDKKQPARLYEILAEKENGGTKKPKC